MQTPRARSQLRRWPSRRSDSQVHAMCTRLRTAVRSEGASQRARSQRFEARGLHSAPVEGGTPSSSQSRYSSRAVLSRVSPISTLIGIAIWECSGAQLLQASMRTTQARRYHAACTTSMCTTQTRRYQPVGAFTATAVSLTDGNPYSLASRAGFEARGDYVCTPGTAVRRRKCCSASGTPPAPAKLWVRATCHIRKLTVRATCHIRDRGTQSATGRYVADSRASRDG